MDSIKLVTDEHLPEGVTVLQSGRHITVLNTNANEMFSADLPVLWNEELKIETAGSYKDFMQLRLTNKLRFIA